MLGYLFSILFGVIGGLIAIFIVFKQGILRAQLTGAA